MKRRDHLWRAVGIPWSWQWPWGDGTLCSTGGSFRNGTVLKNHAEVELVMFLVALAASRRKPATTTTTSMF